LFLPLVEHGADGEHDGGHGDDHSHNLHENPQDALSGDPSAIRAEFRVAGNQSMTPLATNYRHEAVSPLFALKFRPVLIVVFADQKNCL
jgi:hypothetical protein